MALTVVDHQRYPPYPPDTYLPPPPVIITPTGDPWPRPYFFKNGLRRVEPYHYTYNTNCKQRWRDREILAIFRDEFRDRPVEYYQGAIEDGSVFINGSRVPSIHTIVRNGDVISHTTHRHEPPVTSTPIGTVHEDDDILVINKPAGVPVHPAGRYHFNSVVEILRAERGNGFTPLPINRLDRLTSGIMFIGKHKRAADRMTMQMMGRTVKKEYVARVKGEFSSTEVVCHEPILAISPKLGLNRVRANGKHATTVFRRLAYYPHEEAGVGDQQSQTTTAGEKDLPWMKKQGYSIVRCLPLTGRTHQIRVHLQFLGHPITNDPIYCNQKVFGQTLGMGDDNGDNDEDVIARLSRMGKEEVADAVAYHDEMVEDYNKRKAEKMTGEVCEVCRTPLYSDPGPHELGIYLHAVKYGCADGKWEYETSLPDWAKPPPGVAGPIERTPETDPLAVDLARLHIEPENAEPGAAHEETKPSVAIAG